MSKEELFRLIIESKELIDKVVWIVKIEQRVEKDYDEYMNALAKRWSKDKKFMTKLENYPGY